MTPEEFRAKWQGVTASERQAAQSHFEDLCRLIDVPTPLQADPAGKWYAYEKNVLKLDGRPGRADVWRKGCFAWEYKRHKKNLTAATVSSRNTPTLSKTRRYSLSPTCGKSASIPTSPTPSRRRRFFNLRT
jgi:hypothetical protein